jgi:myo-inositol-1(or 4)-monophosphatase
MAEKTPKQPEIERLLLGWVREAGEIALNSFHHSGPLRFKHGREAVTEADREIEKLLSARIRARFPEDGIFGEEFGEVEPETAVPAGRVWHIDPIDGTLNFALGLPNFCTSVALMDGDRILAAIVHQPLLDETFTATVGEGARLGGKPIHVSDRAALKEAIVSAQLQKRGRFIGNAALLQAILLGTMKMRRLGTIALETAYLADGRFDALVAGKGAPQPLYDVAAGILLVQEAGGRVTDHLGEPYRPHATDLIASNGLVHDELIALIRQWDPPPTSQERGI